MYEAKLIEETYTAKFIEQDYLAKINFTVVIPVTGFPYLFPFNFS